MKWKLIESDPPKKVIKAICKDENDWVIQTIIDPNFSNPINEIWQNKKMKLWLDESPSGSEAWVSVEDRLPEVGLRVLIYEPPYDPVSYPEHYLMAVTHYAGRKPKGERYWYTWPDEQDEQPGSYNPTHWMPLPQQPIK